MYLFQPSASNVSPAMLFIKVFHSAGARVAFPGPPRYDSVMVDARETQVRQAEERLRVAMLHSDVKALEELLSDDLIFTTHLGQVVGKADDLAVHRSGALKFHEVTYCDQRVWFHGGVALVSVRVHLAGVFGAAAVADDYRFTRVWALTASKGAWQVIAGHVSAIR
jgi:ketosteroid isomerase-like protein